MAKQQDAVQLDELAEKLDKKFDELPDRIAEKIAECLPTARAETSTTKNSGKNASAVKNPRNPNAAITRRLDRLGSLRGQRDAALDAIGDAIDALDSGDPDEAEEILDEILSEYDVEDDGDNGEG